MEIERKELLKNIRKPSLIDENFSTVQKDDGEKEAQPNVKTPQDKLNKIFIELKKINKSKIEDHFIRDKSAQEEILQEIFDRSVQQSLEKPENKRIIKRIFKNFNLDLVKVQPREIMIILLIDEAATNKFRSFLLDKTIITTLDADLIIKFLCQTNFNDEHLLSKLKETANMSKIVDIFLGGELNCCRPGYYNFACMPMKNISEMPDVIEQIRLRILNERSSSYSVALNHLVNEIHAICIRQESANSRNYDINDVVKFLQSRGVCHEVCIKIRNLFDRRNSNSVSHPSSNVRLAWGVTEQEYLDYYEHVGRCLDCLL